MCTYKRIFKSLEFKHKIIKERTYSLNHAKNLEHNKGHFSGSDNVKELPVVLKELLKIAK